MKKPYLSGVKAQAEQGLAFAKAHGSPLASKVILKSRSAMKTKLGKRIVTGAIAGGAIAYALPFIALTTGAIMGAGALVLIKSLNDKEG